MKNKFLLRLFAIIALGSVTLFWAIDLVSRHTETQMSFISQANQDTLTEYGRHAEKLFLAGDKQALDAWLMDLQTKENTWAAIVEGQVLPRANSQLNERFWRGYGLGRRVERKVHLDFPENPIMEIPFKQQHMFFLIQLPQHMRPGAYQSQAYVVLQLALPLLILCLMSWLIYQHAMGPLRKLASATDSFSQGNLEARATPLLVNRNDEFSRLAETFDNMAMRTSRLIKQQRELLENLSHELRTPLSRLELTLDNIDAAQGNKQALIRLRNESSIMRELVEDTLMLVWLNQEHDVENKENVDVVCLLEVICEDARFEYPNHQLELTHNQQTIEYFTNQRALAQALENIIRNAHQHTPLHHKIQVHAEQNGEKVCIQILDQGTGVPETFLREMFTPFFQIDPQQGEQRKHLPLLDGKRKQGFGLGLALAKRQIHLIGGGIYALNRHQSNAQDITGLAITINLPSLKEDHC
ncbi:histidine kinase sensor domain-containing protein [Marinomonas sp.]